MSTGLAPLFYLRIFFFFRSGARFVLMGCVQSFENCFCVSRSANHSDSYDMSLSPLEDGNKLDCKAEDVQEFLWGLGVKETDVARHTAIEYTFRMAYKGHELIIVAGGTGLSPVRAVVECFSNHRDQVSHMTLISG